jgi:hypothetical protein
MPFPTLDIPWSGLRSLVSECVEEHTVLGKVDILVLSFQYTDSEAMGHVYR